MCVDNFLFSPASLVFAIMYVDIFMVYAAEVSYGYVTKKKI